MQVHNVPRNSSPVKTSTNGVRMHMKVERGSNTAAIEQLAREALTIGSVSISQSDLDTYNVFRLPQDSHISRPFFGRKQVRPEDTAALTNGHIERGTRGALSFGTKVMSV